jgi:23S rRNA (adenine2030-N6)-methyltransferase
MFGSSVFVLNPPHTLGETLRDVLPWLADALAQNGSGQSHLDQGQS